MGLVWKLPTSTLPTLECPPFKGSWNVPPRLDPPRLPNLKPIHSSSSWGSPKPGVYSKGRTRWLKGLSLSEGTRQIPRTGVRGRRCGHSLNFPVISGAGKLTAGVSPTKPRRLKARGLNVSRGSPKRRQGEHWVSEQ